MGSKEREEQSKLMKRNHSLLSSDLNLNLDSRDKKIKRKETMISKRCFEPFSSALQSWLEKEDDDRTGISESSIDQMSIEKKKGEDKKQTRFNFRAVDC